MKTNTLFNQLINTSEIGQNKSISMDKITTLSKQVSIQPSKKDVAKNLLLAIDFQNDFMENGALAVPNSHSDIYNTTNFLLENLEHITDIYASLDTHTTLQIFHPAWWVDKEGNHPSPFTIITYEEILDEKWKPLYRTIDSVCYVKELQNNSKKKLCIWNYHCLEGTVGHSLENQFASAMYFHSIVRKSTPKIITKGENPSTEMYGIIEPEYSETNQTNIDLINDLLKYDQIFVVGEAKSHCVLETVKQMVKYFKEKENPPQIIILTDCMNSIPGFEEETELEFNQLEAENSFINLKKTTEIIF